MTESVFVTGADGFIGSNVVDALVRSGYKVKALSLYNSWGTTGWIEDLDEEVLSSLEVVSGDIRDSDQMRKVAANQDAIIHLAALIAIPYSYHAPRSYVETNVTGTLNILEAAREVGSRVVVTSTSEVYGTPETVPIAEDHALQGQSPYSASKIAADKLAESFALSFELPVTILRPFNTYGPRQSTRAVIPTILTQLLAGVEALKLGSLTPKRDLTFVSDTAEGFLRILKADLAPATTIQLGTGRTVSIAELVDICQRIIGTDIPILTDDQRVRPDASEVMVLLSDPSKAEQLLSWQPTVSLEEGISQTAEWLKTRPSLVSSATKYQL